MDERRKKLLFRSQYRGMRETDLLFGAFAKVHIQNFTSDDLTAFEALLDASDLDVLDWLTGRVDVPKEYDTSVFARLRDFRP